MKLHFIKSLFIVSTILSITATSCLKDDDFENGSIQSVHATGQVPSIVEIGLTATNSSNFLSVAVDASDVDTTINLVPVRLATAGPAPKDIHVTLKLDNGLVRDYNQANETKYHIPDPGMYTIVNPVVTIPQGSRTGYLQIKFKPSDFIGGDWALGFTITSIQESGYQISGNLHNGITAIAIKNAFDGHYSVTGTMTDVYIPDYQGNYPEEVYLITSGANTDVWFNLTYGYFHEIAPGGLVYGGFCPVFTFDAEGNVTDVSNYYSLSDPLNTNQRTAHLDPTGVNKYDFATKTLQVKYVMYQGTLGIDRTTFDETFTYIGPR